MSECQLCGSVNSDMAEICDSCGYSFEGREISNRDKIRAFLVKLAKSQNWVDEIKFKKRINETQIKKYGYSWSERKTAELLDEGNTTTSTDIRLAEALDKYSQLLNCKTKSEAKRRLNEIQNGVTYRGDKPTFQFENDLQKYLHSNWSETPFCKEWELQKTGVFKEGRYNTGVVGEIDLLAKNREEERWLVIELKRGQSSDETIGQILRYMGWVKENLAGKDGKVEGLIICEVADDRIRYALKCVPDIDLKVYCLDNGKLIFKDAQDAHLEALVKKLSPNQLEELIKQLKGET